MAPFCLALCSGASSLSSRGLRAPLFWVLNSIAWCGCATHSRGSEAVRAAASPQWSCAVSQIASTLRRVPRDTSSQSTVLFVNLCVWSRAWVWAGASQCKVSAEDDVWEPPVCPLWSPCYRLTPAVPGASYSGGTKHSPAWEE